MNQVAAETTNEQVHRELSEAKCSMNDTAGDDDGPGGGGEGYGPGDGQRKAYGGTGRGGGGENVGGSGVPGVAAGGLGVYGGGNGDGGGEGDSDDNRKSAADVGAGGAAGAEDAGPQTFDEFYKSPGGDLQPLTLVSSLDEDTCPGKEQPLVDGAPDAAQNSDRVLWESNKSSGVGGGAAALPGSSAATPLLLLLLLSALATARRRYCCC